MEYLKHHRSYQAIVTVATQQLNLKSKNIPWTIAEDNKLKQICNKRIKKNIDSEILNLFPERTKASIINRINTLGISKWTKHVWSKEEDQIIIEYYSKLGKEVLKMLPNITESQLLQRASFLRVKNDNYKNFKKEIREDSNKKELISKYYKENNWEALYKLFPNKTKNNIVALINRLGIKKDGREYSQEQINLINTEYPKLGAKKLKEKYSDIFENKSEATLCHYAKDHGIKFSPAKIILCIELNKKFTSLNEAAKFINRSRAAISVAINNNSIAGGYHWEYIEVNS